MLVDVVVLTAGPELFQSAREAVGEQNPVWRARSAEEAADLLINGRCGVLVIDMAAVSTRADTLIEQIIEQFPDVVVCVAGSRADEPLLAPLISAGLVYRFMHKPTSARRAGMFLQAAIRRHVERREGREASDPLLPLLRGLAARPLACPGGYLALIGLVALALVVPLFVGGEPEAPEATAVTAAPVTPAPESAATGRADPVLSRPGQRCRPAGSRRPKAATRSTCSRPCCSRGPSNARRRPRSPGRSTCCCNARSGNSTLATSQKPNGWCSVCSQSFPMTSTPGPWHLGISPPDTPSRQLSREQREEVEASLTGSTIDSPAAPTHPRTLEEIQTSTPPHCQGRSRNYPVRPVPRRPPRRGHRRRSYVPIRLRHASSIRRRRSPLQRAVTRASQSTHRQPQE